MFIIICCLFLVTACLHAQDTTDCAASEITLVTSALDRIIKAPEDVLAHEDAYWKEEAAQEYTEAWAESVGYSMTRDQWRDQLKDFAKRSAAQRASSTIAVMARQIESRKEDFTALAMPHLCSFLPAGTSLDIPVYFTAFVPPRCFVTGGVIFNVSAGYWKGKVDNIMNALVHELFHVGFSRQRPNRKLPEMHPLLFSMTETLQNEGMATYTGYAARELFPAPDEVDFALLEDAEEVSAALEAVNELLESIGEMPEDALRAESWERGVEQRAYYIAGGHMASVIDAALGREALVATIIDGPLAFIDVYNGLVGNERKVRYPDEESIASRAAEEHGILSIPNLIGIVAVVVLLPGILLFFRRKRQQRTQ